MKTLTQTNFNFPGQRSVYHGKVRDVYDINNDIMVMVATDRISAFDVVLPKGIPFKGQVLNQIAAKFLDASADVVPNWKLATPDPMVTVGLKCEGFRVEMIIRGYLTGSAWRAYEAGERTLCGVALPEGMKENQKFPTPIITPTTKADEGHDENISKEEIIAQGLVSKEDYELMEQYTYKLFDIGTKIAAEKGLILVDTKYEFGKRDGKVYLIDEVHTPDSSRYFYAEGYEEKFAKGEPQRQLSKEFVRKWLIEHNFMNQPGQVMPVITDEYAQSVSDRYIELYDGLNHTLSLGVDRWWRRSAINQIKKLLGARGEGIGTPDVGAHRGDSDAEVRILDVATGTGDLAIDACRRLRPGEIVGCDISEGMMTIGRAKVAEAGLAQRIRFVREDCERLSFADGEFDVVMSAFALRNFEHIDVCLREMRRVLLPGGCVVVIDLCAPRSFPMRQLFWLYRYLVMPVLGRLLSNDRSAYIYLPATMDAITQGDDMAQRFRQAGFRDVGFRYLAFGMCCMYYGKL